MDTQHVKCLLTFIILVLQKKNTKGYCINNGIEWMGNCVAFITGFHTFDDSEKKCRTYDGQLVTEEDLIIMTKDPSSKGNFQNVNFWTNDSYKWIDWSNIERKMKSDLYDQVTINGCPKAIVNASIISNSLENCEKEFAYTCAGNVEIDKNEKKSYFVAFMDCNKQNSFISTITETIFPDDKSNEKELEEMSEKCKSEYNGRTVHNKCFFRSSKIYRDHADAKEFCEGKNSHLANPKTDQMGNVMLDICRGVKCFMGMTRIQNGSWLYGDGSIAVIAKDKWTPGEPSLEIYGQQDYSYVNGLQNGWNDIFQNFDLYSICEIEIKMNKPVKEEPFSMWTNTTNPDAIQNKMACLMFYLDKDLQQRVSFQDCNKTLKAICRYNQTGKRILT